MVSTTVDSDYLVVGAGATGMAFTDALVGAADVQVTMIDRRHRAGGHWLDAYPFVRLHLASELYGVASTLLGDNQVQVDGPEAGLPARASAAEIDAYYQHVMAGLTASGKVSFHPNCEYLGDGRFLSRISGQQYEVSPDCRVVDARYLSPDIPACTSPPFTVADGSRAIAVNDLVGISQAPSQYVIAGSGKTATDACVWLLGNGVDPEAICWIRPRDPWMFNRAVFQPDPAVFFGMSADMMEASANAATPDQLFLELEAAGIMFRIDPAVTPTMARTPTVSQWELNELQSIKNVIRQGHIRAVTPGHIQFAEGDLPIAPDAIVVHCAASGLKCPPLVPVWGEQAITVQLVGNALPCFGAALIGYVEATRGSDDEKNRLCPPLPYPNSPTDWVRTQVLSEHAFSRFCAEPDIKAWADGTNLHPARVPPGLSNDADVVAAVHRYQQHRTAGLAQMARFCGLPEGETARQAGLMPLGAGRRERR